METRSYHLFTFLITLIFLIPMASSSSIRSPSNFIKRSCYKTTYPQICYKYLSKYAVPVQSDSWKLCNRALWVSLQSARNTSMLVYKMSKQRGLTKVEIGIVQDCIENVHDSIDELRQSMNAMGQIWRSKNVDLLLSDIKTWVSAAITDEDTCTDGFDGRKVNLVLKNKIRRSIVNIGQLTSVALSLINNLNL